MWVFALSIAFLARATAVIDESLPLSHPFFRTPFVVPPARVLQNETDFSEHIFFGRKLLPIATPFKTNKPTGYISAYFYFDGKEDKCLGMPTKKSNALGICFPDFSNGGTMMFTSTGVPTNDQLLFYQHYYTTADCTGSPLTEVQFLPTKCVPARYSDPVGKGSPYTYVYSETLEAIDDYGVLLSGYIINVDCMKKQHVSYTFWFPAYVCQNGMIIKSCQEDDLSYYGNTTIDYYSNTACDKIRYNHSKTKSHKHCLASTDDDEPENNYYSTRCTGVPHGKGLRYRDVYIFPFCFASSETVQLEEGNRTVSIVDVQVGDRVLAANRAGELVYSEVIAVPHAVNTYRAKFHHFHTASGRDIKMMEKHVVMVDRQCRSPTAVGHCRNPSLSGGWSAWSIPAMLDSLRDWLSTECRTQPELAIAEAVTVGDCFKTVEGWEEITDIEIVEGNGIHTFVTYSDMVVVNGVVASAFAGNHVAANSFYNAHRLLYRLWPSLLQWSWIKKANEIFGRFIVVVCVDTVFAKLY